MIAKIEQTLEIIMDTSIRHVSGSQDTDISAIEKLPEEILLLIFNYVKFESLPSLITLNKKFSRISLPVLQERFLDRKIDEFKTRKMEVKRKSPFNLKDRQITLEGITTLNPVLNLGNPYLYINPTKIISKNSPDFDRFDQTKRIERKKEFYNEVNLLTDELDEQLEHAEEVIILAKKLDFM